MAKNAFILLLLLFSLSACSSDAPKQVVGAWKSELNDSITGKPITLVIAEDTVSIDSNSAKITLSEDKNRTIIIRRAGEQKPILTATVLDNERVLFINHIFGEKVFVRSTPAEVQAILAAPSPSLTSKPDPF